MFVARRDAKQSGRDAMPAHTSPQTTASTSWAFSPWNSVRLGTARSRPSFLQSRSQYKETTS